MQQPNDHDISPLLRGVVRPSNKPMPAARYPGGLGEGRPHPPKPLWRRQRGCPI
jgi:hypothetical protein